MLSPREEIQLAEIERQLVADDPALSARLGGMRRRHTWLRALTHVGAALLTIFVGLFVGIEWAIAILALTALIAVMMIHSRRS
ncbi:MAG: DUF3040 domain-containing protein [Hamadaea sp.]|nr:DUF3040 domain-containing protein [Hamadaea sp.]NUT02921.1 DUF3040 domain-containing protein [Hamadaea sp.]